MTKRHPLFMPVILVGGLLFGFGLAWSQMARPEVVLSFLQFSDFGLLLVMAAAAGVAGLVFQLASRSKKEAPLTGARYALRKDVLDSKILIGGAIFGVGWGLSGICPGAAYASLGIGNYPVLIGIAGMFLGAYLFGTLMNPASPDRSSGQSTTNPTAEPSAEPRTHEGCG